MRLLSSLSMTFACLIVIGCGDPPLHPITGNITLDGRPYERLIVYMDPMEGDVTTFNKGVGETDVTGKLIMNSSASTAESQGLATGKYRVYFNCWMQKGKAVGLSDEKADDSNRKLETEDIVPEPYNNPLESPVVFEVKAGDNVFDYNIPKS